MKGRLAVTRHRVQFLPTRASKRGGSIQSVAVEPISRSAASYASKGVQQATGLGPIQPRTAPAPSGQYSPLVFGGGPLMNRMELVSLYWGNFSQQNMDDMQAYLRGLADWISGRGQPPGQVPVLWQYETACARVGASFFESQRPASGSATDQDVHDQVVAAQANGYLPAFDRYRLFLVFTKGITFTDYGTVWCGYHGAWGDGQYYALCPYPESGGCGSGAPLQSWESVTSHEVMEAATDPTVGGGWTEGGEEGGDVCAWQEVALPFGTVQRFADNSQSACSIWTPQVPAFWVSPFFPWPGYGVPNGLWMVGDFNGDGRSDILHAVQDTDYVNVWEALYVGWHC
jgi:hypothetical protein